MAKGSKPDIPYEWFCTACTNFSMLSALPFYQSCPLSPPQQQSGVENQNNQYWIDKHLEIIKSKINHLSTSETWLKDNPLLLQHVSIPSYELCYNNRDKCRGGGVGAYIKESIKFK